MHCVKLLRKYNYKWDHWIFPSRIIKDIHTSRFYRDSLQQLSFYRLILIEKKSKEKSKFVLILWNQGEFPLASVLNRNILQ